MKKKPVKNRKRELHNKRLLYISLFFGFILVAGSIVFVVLRITWPSTYISPMISAEKPSVTNKNTSKDIVIMQEIKKALNQADISYIDIHVLDSNTWQITLNGNEQVIISINKDILQQIASLQLITTRLTMEGKRFSRLDLRYDQPVLSE